MHYFKNSKNIEDQTDSIHLKYLEEKLKKDNPDAIIVFTKLNYETEQLKQKEDSDYLVSINGVNTYISFKTRTKDFNDFYLEIISQFTGDQTKDNITFSELGWAVKFKKCCSTPNYLSYLIVDNGVEQHFLIQNYKQVKETIFKEYVEKNVFSKIENKDFTFYFPTEEFLKALKSNMSKKHFFFKPKTELNKLSDSIEVILAKNEKYITCGIAVDRKKIKYT